MDNGPKSDKAGSVGEPCVSSESGSALASWHLNMPALADALYRLRRRRERAFANLLFSEPSWDLLLELLLAEKTGKRISVTSACIAAAAPTTTALRCLKQFEAQGLIYREPDPADGRRVHIRMSPEALNRMEHLLEDLYRLLRNATEGAFARQRF